jgi:hypothetical protein
MEQLERLFQNMGVYYSRFVIVTVGHAVTYLVEAYATSQKVTSSCPDEVIFFNLPNPSSCTMALGSTQPLTEMSTRNCPGGKGLPACKADNLTALCELIV